MERCEFFMHGMSFSKKEVQDNSEKDADDDACNYGKIEADLFPLIGYVPRKLSEERNLVDYQQYYTENGDNDTDDDEPEAHIESSVHCWRPS